MRPGSRGPVLVATKLHPPAVREQTVWRERLLERLRSGSDLKLSVIACPAGFGKTTLLAAWRQHEAERKAVAWLTLDEGDNDPVVLWSYVIEALRRVCPTIECPSPETVGANAIVELVLPHLVNDLDSHGDVVLIVDDFHLLSNPDARDSVAWFVDHAPPGFQLVASTRTEPGLRMAALRAHGELLELRADDLRFSPEEADAFLNGRLGLGLAAQDIADLVERTEGWPAGMYLAALSLRGVAERHDFVSRFGVSNRHVVDFLVTEVLETHDPPTQELMLRCSILDRLSGTLCDAVMERKDSADTLASLARTNLFLVSLDEEGDWYRFHRLFAQLLRMELEQREPDLIATLHRRASDWHCEHGTTDEAIRHAVAAGAHNEAAHLIKVSWLDYTNRCRHASVLAWLHQLPDGFREADPHLLLIEAWVLSLTAKREEAERVIHLVERHGRLDRGPLPDGFASLDSSLCLLRGSLPWGDVGAQLQFGRRANELEGPESTLRAPACWAMGMGHYYRGEFDQADQSFAESVALAPAGGMWIVSASSLAYRSMIAGERGRVDDQRLLAEEAGEQAREYGVEEIDGEVALAQGESLVARDRLGEAVPLIERGVDVLRSYGQPIDLANALLHQGSLLRKLGQDVPAAAAISEARILLESCPDPGILTERLASLESSARPPRLSTGSGNQDLTQQELRVLKALTSQLSERDIAGELFLSHHTVHSHVRAIYRKLGVSSRADAVEEARRINIL